MAEKSLKELIHEINVLVGRYQTTKDSKEKTQRLEEGLALACLAMRELNQLLKEFAATLFSECGLGKEQAKLEFIAVVSGNDEFGPFQSQPALRAFLEATEALLVEQLRLTEDEIKGLHSAVDATYVQFMHGYVGLDEMRHKFKRLEDSFCQAPKVPILTQIFEGAVKTLGWIGPLIGVVVKEWGGAAGGLAAQLRSPEKRTVALLSVLMLSGLSDKLAKAMEAVTVPAVTVPAGTSAGR